MRAASRKDGSRHVVQIGHQACSFGHLSDVLQFMTPPERVGQISALVMRNYRNTPRHKAQWARPALLTADVNIRNVGWNSFLGETPVREFDANRFIHWRYFWDY